MGIKDPFGPSSRWRLLPVPALALAFVALVVSLGLVSPGRRSLSRDDLHARLVTDFYRLRHAVTAFVTDTGAFPAAAFDLSEGPDGGLGDKTLVPMALVSAWKGPYLAPPLARPTLNAFWSLAEPCSKNDGDGDGEADELWARLNRGSGEVDDPSAAWLDRMLDDGVADRGTVRVTDTWIWFQMLER